MTDLFLIYLSAVVLEEGVLLRFADDKASRWLPGSVCLLVASVILGVLVFSTSMGRVAARSSLDVFILSLAFTMVMSGVARPAIASTGLERLRRPLPFVVAVVAVCAFASLDARRPHTVAATMGFCAVASMTMMVGLPVAAALRERVQLARAPAVLRGAPIAMMSASIVALGLSGFVDGLPW